MVERNGYLNSFISTVDTNRSRVNDRIIATHDIQENEEEYSLLIWVHYWEELARNQRKSGKSY